MNAILNWLKKHKIITTIACLVLFALPLIIIHCLYKWNTNISWFVAEWSAGDVLSYVAGFEAFIGTVALGALALWQNSQIHEHHIESLEPNLSMKLISVGGFLYLVVENTGAIEAKSINISVLSICQNGDNSDLELDQLFETTFELYPRETVQGRIALSGANIVTEIFPQIKVHISYLRPDINRKKEYERTVTYCYNCDKKILADINYDNSAIASDVDKIARANVRMANYLDGHQVAKFDELNILSGRSLRNDLVEAIKTKEEVPVLDRTQTLDKVLKPEVEEQNNA